MERIRDLIEKAAEQTPKKTFFILDDREISYEDFLLAVKRVANGFLSLGVRKGDRFAILLHNYDYLRDRGLPVAIHASVNFSLHRSIDYGRSLFLGLIACDFPRLTVVANHGGRPWVAEKMDKGPSEWFRYREQGGGSPRCRAGLPSVKGESECNRRLISCIFIDKEVRQ
jgi:predicted TIM-barrel fold metal-dependent hydrolase